MNDGGYLIPDCLDGISVCLSPGVDRTADFERELADMGIRSHLIDKTVDAPPDGFTPLSFTKKFVGPVTCAKTDLISIQDWLDEVGETAREDMILQMDIEGAEYATLLATPRNIRRQFRIIVLELHNLNALGNRAFLQVFRDFSDMLLQDHVVVHAHPNNIRSPVRLGEVVLHPFLELTLLRRDVLRDAIEEHRHDLPHPLDHPCVPELPDAPLATGWFAGRR
ncbi:FkbM family methyltransferase [Falsihalocynthiibacter sp. BN13B15]|uniref:FkbM family methyltransferase n=1 Tax=Falsihalocynthiibacter sp. BN13B15 TaxID=3240871 RepID=UPI00350F0650